MIGRKWAMFILLAGFTVQAGAQRIVYSQPEKDDTRRMVFEIAGKIGNNFLVYKNNRANRHVISVLDNDMKEITASELDYIPSNERLINIDFFPYNDFCYLIYQYQKKNVVYCMASKIDAMGKTIAPPVEVDTTQIPFSANNKIYTVLTSEDKGRIMIFKINTRNRKMYTLTSKLLDDKLGLIKRSRMYLPMEERNEFLSDFHVDNDGDMVFAKFYRNSNDNISNARMMIKYAMADSISTKELNIEKNWLDEIQIKADNAGKRFLLTSFYFKERRGNIDGLYFYFWDKKDGTARESVYTFTEEQRREARGDASVKSAFNDFFIRNIITRKDGGFIIGSESYYTTSRFNNWNRWDYLYGAPFYNNSINNYYYSPYYNSFWGGSRFGSSSQAVRYHADNIAVLSFSSKGELEWSNVMGKSQFDDMSDDLLSYQLVNTGGQLHFLFNLQEKRTNLLTDFSISPDGQLSRNPTLKNLDKGYEFMPQYAKQVSSRQMIIPCAYRNYICFAKLEYN